MLRRVPTTAVPISLVDIIAGLKSLVRTQSFINEFEKAFAEYIGVKYAFAVNSGTTAFYMILKAFRQFSAKDEVILPAYTVPTLTLAIREAGLKTTLCDISRDTFNMSNGSLQNRVTERTLCIVPVHMFGFPCELEQMLRFSKENSIFVFEDAAQAPGAMIVDRKVGSIGDMACFSLCKGKNLSTFHGGFITTNSDELADAVKKELAELPEVGVVYNLAMPLIMIAYAMVMKPTFYGAMYPLVTNFKSTSVHESFNSSHYTEFQAGIGLKLLSKLEEFNQIRYKNGMKFYRALKDDESLIIPKLIPGGKAVFNHFPVVFKDQVRREKLQKKLWEVGVDTARMYMKPIHFIYDLGYKREADPFPNATFVAEGLVTLPSHPYVSSGEIEKIIDTFEKIR